MAHVSTPASLRKKEEAVSLIKSRFSKKKVFLSFAKALFSWLSDGGHALAVGSRRKPALGSELILLSFAGDRSVGGGLISKAVNSQDDASA